MKPGSQNDGQPIFVTYFVVLSQLGSSFHYGASMLEIVVNKFSVDFLLDILLDVRLYVLQEDSGF